MSTEKEIKVIRPTNTEENDYTRLAEQAEAFAKHTREFAQSQIKDNSGAQAIWRGEGVGDNVWYTCTACGCQIQSKDEGIIDELPALCPCCNARMSNELGELIEGAWQQRQEALYENTIEMAEWAYACWKACVDNRSDSQARVYAEIFAKLCALPMPYYYPGGVAAV